MRLNAVLNSLILIIQLSTLMSECHGDTGLFCSRIRSSQFVQFFRIIIGEYVSNCLRLMVNFVYVGFALNRLSLVGKDHEKYTLYVSTLTISQFMTRIAIPCLVLPIVKVFRFMPNSSQPGFDYPNPIAFYFSKIKFAYIYVYLAFDIFLDLINYFAFFLINLFIDVNLAIKMRKIMKEKELKFKIEANKKK